MRCLHGVSAIFAAVFFTAAPALAGPPPTVLYSFKGTTDGGQPEAGVFFGQDGLLYGVAGSGGTNNNGTIFTLAPPATEGGKWTYKVIYRLKGGTGGGGPQGLIQGKDGTLYGYALNFGGPVFAGTVFRLKRSAPSAAWQFETIYRFNAGSDGAYPNGLAVMPNGNLIGTTSHGGTGPCRFPGDEESAGCGTVFTLAPPKNPKAKLWTETILHAFKRNGDGAIPSGAPILHKGVWYGVTVEGGTGTCTTPVYPDNNGCGAIYKLEESVPGVWDESLAFSFADVPQGWSPIGPLTGNGKGTFYGVTYSGGAVTPNGLGKGTAYRLVLKDGEFVFTQLHIFNGGFDAESPDSPLVIGAGNQLFGASSLGSTGGLGSIFNVQPPLHPWGKWSVSMIAPFSSAGAGPYYPEGKIIMDGSGRIYGVTPSGGKNNKGTIYMVNP